MENFNFTEEEINQELEKLGYYNVPKEKLVIFKQDLKSLISDEKSQRSWCTTSSVSSPSENKHTHLYTNNYRPEVDNHFNGHHNFPLNGDHCNHINKLVSDNYGVFDNKKVYDSRGNMHEDLDSKIKSTKNVTGKENMQILPNFNSDPIIINAPSFTKTKENESPNSSLINSSSTSSDSRYIKRRVLRKINGHVKIDDELVESEYGDYSALEDKLGLLNMHNSEENYNSQWDPQKRLQCYMSGRKDIHYRPHSSCSSRSDDYRISEDFDIHKAFIRPMSCDPHSRHLKKHDPVSAYHKYKTSWMTNKAPGEKNHKNLRWAVREQMLQHDEIIEKKPAKSHAPNKYIIPSDKKRDDLRWHIRHELAHGIKPISIFDE